MSTPSLSHQTVAALSGVAPELLSSARVLVGFDGFVDTIIHVVDKRTSATEFTRLNGLDDFGKKISAAAGLSANFELITEMQKLGGNGPIMANALIALGCPLTYIGLLGSPAIHPVFADLAGKAEVISIAEPGLTDAFEFDDGKLMFGKHEALKEINWQNLLAHVDVEALTRHFSDSRMAALVNWTMLTRCGEIWENILTEIAPRLEGPKRWVFFDLCDPAKRTVADLVGALQCISRFEKFFHVILGLNFNESVQIGEALGLPVPEQTHEAVAAHAGAIRGKLGLHTVVVHPSRFAAAADETGVFAVEGPYTDKPRITTGAGDHFNAGFSFGRLLGLELPVCLQIGVATSGFYVREAQSPSVADLQGFLSRQGQQA